MIEITNKIGMKTVIEMENDNPNIITITMFSPDDDYMSMDVATADVLNAATKILKQLSK